MLGTALRYLFIQFFPMNGMGWDDIINCFVNHKQEEAWAAGGSGILLKTTNSGKTWIRDKAADNIAANLYSVK